MTAARCALATPNVRCPNPAVVIVLIACECGHTDSCAVCSLHGRLLTQRDGPHPSCRDCRTGAFRTDDRPETRSRGAHPCPVSFIRDPFPPMENQHGQP